jgi:protease-4
MNRVLSWCGAFLVAATSSGCIFVSGGINPFVQERERLQETVVSGEGREKIVLLDVSDVITSVERDRAFGFGREESTVARVQEALRAAEQDERVRAVVLRINSPGGGVTASDTIYREVTRFRTETGRPVIAALMDTATSGAYYVALAADRIVASPTTVTGSIGVILVGLNVEGLMGKLGIKDQTIKSGVHKDLLSPFRGTTAEERRILQDVIDGLHDRFVSLVEARRPAVAAANLPRATDGRIFTAVQARDLGLVDAVGYLDDALSEAHAAAGLENARVVMYHRRREYRENIYSHPGERSPALSGGTSLSVTLSVPEPSGPRFMYLWVPRLHDTP